MKQITVISGKGGTGKTTITACLAKMANNFVIADCDVDAADLYLLLNPKQGEANDFYSGKKFFVDTNKCIKCGKCKELCRYGAIDINFNIDSIDCDGCGACYFVCPVKAISVKNNLAGEYYISSINNGKTPFVHANLHIAEDNSGKLVAQVRKESSKMAEKIKAKYIIIDGPPGISCPVNAAIAGIDLALIVTEPTLSGIHDLKRILDVTKHFGVDSKVIINKYNINPENTQYIENFCLGIHVECIEKIEYDKEVVKTLIKGKTIIEELPRHNISRKISKIWSRIQ